MMSAARTMVQPWSSIREFYADLVQSELKLTGLLKLVTFIEDTPLSSGLHGWTSMLELNISQTPEVYWPDPGPTLKIIPDFKGNLEYRYIDTYDKSRQWVRVVPEAQGIERLLGFLNQLHWFSELPDRPDQHVR
jgi:hypothetical protein